MAWLDFKTAVIPPVIALAIYVGTVYFLVPLYRRRQFYSQYLPVALVPSDEPGFISRARGRIQESLRIHIGDRLWHRRGSSDLSFDIGDEELEEDIRNHLHGRLEDHSEAPNRRLSRDLEAGFRDDSDDDDRNGDDTQRRLSMSRN